MISREIEIWKDIVGYEGLYQVSNLGNIRSLDRIVSRAKGDYLRKGKVFNKTIDSLGYAIVGFTINSKTKSYKVHRLVEEAFISNPDNKPCINHKDGNKANNHIDNLEWCTHEENTNHAFKTGLRTYLAINEFQAFGENNTNAKLTLKEVSEIRAKYIPFEYSARKLVLEYNVSQSCITHILNNTSWKENVQ